MSMNFLLGVPGKLKTLTDRWTAAKAAFLDAAISSRFSASSGSTVLSNQTTLSGKLDDIEGSGFSSSSDSLKVLSDRLTTLLKPQDVHTEEGYLSSGTAGDVTVLNISGAGYLDFVVITVPGHGSYIDFTDVKVTIDGGTEQTLTFSDSCSNLAIFHARFSSSLVVKVERNSSYIVDYELSYSTDQ